MQGLRHSHKYKYTKQTCSTNGTVQDIELSLQCLSTRSNFKETDNKLSYMMREREMGITVSFSGFIMN